MHLYAHSDELYGSRQVYASNLQRLWRALSSLSFEIQSNHALRTPVKYGHLIITDSLLCPWKKRALRFSLLEIQPD